MNPTSPDYPAGASDSDSLDFNISSPTSRKKEATITDKAYPSHIARILAMIERNDKNFNRGDTFKWRGPNPDDSVDGKEARQKMVMDTKPKKIDFTGFDDMNGILGYGLDLIEQVAFQIRRTKYYMDIFVKENGQEEEAVEKTLGYLKILILMAVRLKKVIVEKIDTFDDAKKKYIEAMTLNIWRVLQPSEDLNISVHVWNDNFPASTIDRVPDEADLELLVQGLEKWKKSLKAKLSLIQKKKKRTRANRRARKYKLGRRGEPGVPGGYGRRGLAPLRF